MAATSRPRGIIPSVAPARLPESSFKPVAVAAPADTSSVITPMTTVADASAAKRPKRTRRRLCGRPAVHLGDREGHQEQRQEHEHRAEKAGVEARVTAAQVPDEGRGGERA